MKGFVLAGGSGTRIPTNAAEKANYAEVADLSKACFTSLICLSFDKPCF